MPHYFDSGFTVREPAWHRLGYVGDRYPNDWQEAREWAGLTWEPVSAPSFMFSGIDADGNTVYNPDDAVTGDYFADPNRQRIVRSDNGFTLGVPSSGYEIITHAEMGEIVDAILNVPNVKYETAGSLKGGKEVWALAYLDEPIVLPGDNTVTLPYLAVLTNHDGNGGTRAISTNVRVVCANTFSAAETQGERNSTVFTFRHSKTWRDRIDEARQTITGVRNAFHEYAEFAEELYRTKVTEEQIEMFIREIIPSPPEGLATERVLNNINNDRQAIRNILNGKTTETIAGTAYGLVQAAGEFLDHYRRARSADSYFRRQLLQPQPLKTKAVKLAQTIAM